MEKTSWSDLAKLKWNERAAFWNENTKAMWETGSRRDILPFFKKHVKSSGHVLDIGCGAGYSTYKLDHAGYDVVGMDVSEKMIQIATKQYPDIPFRVGDINHPLPFAKKSFSAALAITVLEWAEIPRKTLEELYRILQDDGMLCVGLLGPTAGPRVNSYDRLSGKQAMMNTMMPWELAKLATETGWKLIDHFGVPKKWANPSHENLPLQAQQALSFMWVFCFRKGNDHHDMD